MQQIKEFFQVLQQNAVPNLVLQRMHIKFSFTTYFYYAFKVCNNRFYFMLSKPRNQAFLSHYTRGYGLKVVSRDENTREVRSAGFAKHLKEKQKDNNYNPRKEEKHKMSRHGIIISVFLIQLNIQSLLATNMLTTARLESDYFFRLYAKMSIGLIQMNSYCFKVTKYQTDEKISHLTNKFFLQQTSFRSLQHHKQYKQLNKTTYFYVKISSHLSRTCTTFYVLHEL
eukprot:TRINITY_DN7609_c0_g1_i6.p2 TRINITY_DN7609_c0_g1~~TRINITY_DN7609_c0_g1_i6.p2  ORF type:complete len:226 (+),score=-11.31 TRINITY_DN7609_c0_g1_i6:993-1670(+)